MNLHIHFIFLNKLEKFLGVLFKFIASDDVAEERWAEKFCVFSRKTSKSIRSAYREQNEPLCGLSARGEGRILTQS
jgi:hypothetical protein